MNVETIIQGITYTAVPDTNGCDGCHAEHDIELCSKLQQTNNSSCFCNDYDIIWLKLEQPAVEAKGTTTQGKSAAVEGPSRFQLYGTILNLWTTGGGDPARLSSLSLQEFLEFCYTNQISIEAKLSAALELTKFVNQTINSVNNQ